MTRTVRVPIKGHEGKYVELIDYDPTEVVTIIEAHYGLRPGSRGGSVADRADPVEAAEIRQSDDGSLVAAKREAIRQYLLSLPAKDGYEHSTDSVFMHFFGRRISYSRPGEMQIAKTTAHNLRRAHADIATSHDGKWEATMTGPRSKGGTKHWRFVRG